MEPPFWGDEEVVCHRGSAMVPLERATVVSYRLSIVTVALSVTIRPQFAIECLRRSNQQGVGDFWPKFRGVPLRADPSCWGCKERTSQANWRWNFISEEFQPMWSQFTNVTGGQTDRQTTCDRNTALCTKVHRVVNSKNHFVLNSIMNSCETPRGSVWDMSATGYSLTKYSFIPSVRYDMIGEFSVDSKDECAWSA